jgi:hypothetical protein
MDRSCNQLTEKEQAKCASCTTDYELEQERHRLQRRYSKQVTDVGQDKVERNQVDDAGDESRGYAQDWK